MFRNIKRILLYFSILYIYIFKYLIIFLIIYIVFILKNIKEICCVFFCILILLVM